MELIIGLLAGIVGGCILSSPGLGGVASGGMGLMGMLVGSLAVASAVASCWRLWA